MQPPIGSGSPTVDAAGVAIDVVSGSVICGIGDRDLGRRVAALAAGLAKALDAPLTAVRVEAEGATDGSRAAALQRGHALLEDVLSEAEREHAAVTRQVKLGDPATRLIAVAADEQAELLVVGAGRGPAPGPPLGPVPRKLAMRATCPVVVAPRGPASAETHQRPQRHLLCAFDGSDDARQALGVAATVAERLGTAAFVAHMSPGCVREVEARAHAEQAALIVAPSSAAEGRHPAPARPAPARWGTNGSTPVLLVPPTYCTTAAPPLRVAAAG
jgi:nucleotide-binding universal stress UspA family protein